MVKEMGIEDERLRLEWISAAEGERVRIVMNDMVEKVRALGPLTLKSTRRRPLPEEVAVRMSDKPKVAFYWCASCGGCEEAVVDLAENILDVVAAVDIVLWPVALDFKRKDVEAMPDGAHRGHLPERRHPHHRAGGDGAPAAQEVAVHHRLRRLRATGRHSGPGQSLESQELLTAVYRESPSTVNPEGTRPQQVCTQE